MKNEKKWHVVYTRPKCERKIAQLLSKRNIENYCPLNKTVRQLSDKKKDTYEPVFTSYVFVYATEAECTTIRQTDGIINFVYWLDKPVIINDTEIEAIHEFLEDHQTVALERIKVNIQDKVKVIRGNFMQWEGSAIEINTRKAKLMLPSFGYAITAEIENVNTELLPGKRYIRATYAAN
jgi:transcription antitermination factor NusG